MSIDERRVRRSGTTVWVDLSTTDVQGATRFYGQLLGWEHDQAESATGTYVVARIAAGDVGGIMAERPAEVTAGVPPAWTVVVGTDDLEATVAHARGLSGSVLQEPMPIPGGARIAVVADPTGAILALMEAPLAGSRMVWGEPGGVCWVECLSRDPAVSRHFYEQLFGWTSEDGGTDYVVFSLDGERVGGLMAMPPTVPAEAPSYWLVYFTADVAVTCARATELGGRVLVPTHGVGESRFAVLADPAGAVFAVLDGTPT